MYINNKIKTILKSSAPYKAQLGNFTGRYLSSFLAGGENLCEVRKTSLMENVEKETDTRRLKNER